MTDTLPVLIIGAGPTGLAAAATLARQGVRARIVDRMPARTDKSKALGVQAGTLECLQAAFGQPLVDAMIADGRPTRTGWLHLNDRKIVRLNLGTIPSRYNYVLMLEQSETERHLEQLLQRHGGQVERKVEFLDAHEESGRIVAQLRHADGRIEEAACSYLVGCDGAHSPVRHRMGVPFVGGQYTGEFMLGDVHLTWNEAPDSLHLFASARGVIAAFPLRQDGRYRLILASKTQQPTGGEELGLEEFRTALAAMSLDTIRITAAHWLTRFSVHHRRVDQYRKGRMLLAGDAAHIHSPAGGQGMNTGIQDAINLGFKLADVLAGRRSAEALDEYGRERIPVAAGVVRGTDFLFRMALRRESPLVTWMRGNLVPLIVGTPWIQRRAAALVSEVAVARREIARYPR